MCRSLFLSLFFQMSLSSVFCQQLAAKLNDDHDDVDEDDDLNIITMIMLIINV